MRCAQNIRYRSRELYRGGSYVGVEMEEVGGVVLGLDLAEPLVLLGSVAGDDPIFLELGHEVDVAGYAACVGDEVRPEGPDPCPVGFEQFGGGCHRGDVERV